jgi:4-diphosphocytidyl-2C-methyl-D-erythritol kinase
LFLVAIPPFRLATAQVYAAWDELGGPDATRRVEARGPVVRIVEELRNDLEPAAEAVEPGMVDFRRALESAAGRPALMAGSGSAYVVPLDRGDDAAGLAESVSRRLRVPVAGASTTTVGVRVGS